MKYIYIYILLIIGFISGCKKENAPVLGDPDARKAEALKMDQAALLAAENGWLATIYPKGGKGYSFYIKFKADGKVTMLSDFNTTTASVPSESTYRLKPLQRPTLIFDTYGYIHMPFDPDGSVNGGSTGTGLKSDFEFALENVTGNTLKLEGIFNENILTMTKLSAADEAKILAGSLKTRLDENAAYVVDNKYPFLEFNDGVKAAFVIDPGTKLIKLSYVDDKNVTVNATSAYAMSLTGVLLSSPINYKGNSFSELLWDPIAKTYSLMLNGTKLTIKNSTFPLIPLENLLGYAKDYTYIEYNPANLAGSLGVDWDARFKVIATEMKALVAANVKRDLNYIRLTFGADNSATLRFNYITATQNLFADVTYAVSKDANGNIKLTFVTWNSNASGTNGPVVAKARLYFENNTFKPNWVANTIPGSTALLGGLTAVADPNSFFYGIVGK